MGTKGSKLETKPEADVEVHKLNNVEIGNDSSKDNSSAITPDKLSEALLVFKNVLKGRSGDKRSITIKPLGEGSKQAYDYIFPKEKYIASRRNDTFNDILNGETWRKYEYEIKLSLRRNVNPSSSSKNVSAIEDENEKDAVYGTFTFLHLLILCQEFDILRQIAQTQRDILNEEVARKVTIRASQKIEPKSVVKKDNWIFNANCLHLAAKFMPGGLKLIFENLDNHISLINVGNHNQCTPLHLSANNITSLSTRILLEFGANVDSVNSEGYTPLFCAASTGSSANLIELLDHGHADVNRTANDGKTALTKARSYETVMILTKYGIETKKQHMIDGRDEPETDLDVLIQHHFEASPRAILNQCISEVNEELVVLDFGHFENTLEKNNEMDIHIKVHKHGMDELLLHPILQAFLEFKWSMFQYTFMLHLMLELLLVVLLTIVGQHFMGLIFCRSYGYNISDQEWFMDIRDSTTKSLTGRINYFGSTCHDKENCDLLNSTTNRLTGHINSLNSKCQDKEQCALVNFPNDTSGFVNVTAMYNGLRCRKNFLRTAKDNGLKLDTPYTLGPICDAIGQTINECWHYNGWVVSVQIILAILVIREILELSKMGWSYFKEIENYIQLFHFLLTIVFIQLAPHHLVLANHFGAWAVFIAWGNLVQFLRNTSFVGKNITIAIDVSVKLAKVLLVFAPSLLAFTFAFNMMLHANDNFHDIRESIVKIFAMMTGEFEFEANFGWKAVDDIGGRNLSTQILFFMFVIFLAVIIMNLLIGLTVTSIEALNQQGQKVKAVKRLDAIVKSVVFSNGYAVKLSEKMKNLTSKVKRKRTFPRSKVCIKLGQPSHRYWDYFEILKPVYELWHYNDGNFGKKVENAYLTKQIVDSAREYMKTYEEEVNDFQSKINQIKKESKQLYKNLEAEWETSENQKSIVGDHDDALEVIINNYKMSKEAIGSMIELLKALESKAA